MAAREINVAYDGTYGDLASTGADPLLFGNDDFDFSKYFGETTGAASDGFTAINGINGATVSPKDLYADSVPPSTSFTNLTTPGSTFIETPDDEYQTSPLFSNDNSMDTANDTWYSLFPESDNSTAALGADMARTTSASSGNQIMVHPGGATNRKRSSANASPTAGSNSPALRMSSVAGVASRKRDKPLAPIMVDETDATALKRARNTAAARKSRAKKVEEREALESKISDLESQVAYWKQIALAHGATDDDEA